MKRGQFNKTHPKHFDFGAHRKPFGVSSFNRLVRQYKANAKSRGLEFNLTDEQVAALTKCPCAYCGRIPSQSMSSRDSHGAYIYNGIDRKDPSIGYTVDNTLPACKVCNRGKSNMPYLEWVEYLARIRTWNSVEH